MSEKKLIFIFQVKLDSKMPIDLTFLTAKRAEEMTTCTRKATELLEIYEQRSCCETCGITISEDVSNDASIIVIQKYNDLTAAILYSSGYWCKVIKNKKVNDEVRRISWCIVKMTAEEKVKAHNANDMD